MVEQKFINREWELKFLQEAYKSERNELIVVYGRRRVGKTVLALKSIENNKNAIYFFAEETTEEENRKTFRKLVADYLGDKILEKADLGWEKIFATVAERAPGTVIVIDEFPNLIRGNRAIVSKFQKMWDSLNQSARIKLVLLGSSVSVMESEVLSYKSPLYGRRTGQIRLRPLNPIHLSEFFPEMSWEERVKIYGITDMIPAYLWEAKARIGENKDIQAVFAPGTMLFEEAEFLLRYELREPARYYEVLEAIAKGATKFGEICNETGFPAPVVSQYLSRLELLGIVKKETPLLESPKRRNARYKISDNYFRFWFRFIYPNRSIILREGRLQGFEEEYNKYMGSVFEGFWREVLPEFLPGIQHAGKWWHKSEEIDVVATAEGNRVYALEVKWKDLTKADARRLLAKLKKKVEKEPFRKHNVKTGVVGKHVDGKEEFRGEGFVVLDLSDLEVLGKRSSDRE